MATNGSALRSAIAGLARRKKDRRYPAGLRQQVVAYARRRMAGGASAAAVCAELDIGEPTLTRFLAARSKQLSFKQVRLLGPIDTPRAAPLVRGPCGVIVEGLSLNDVVHLVGRLSCLG